MLDEGSSKQRRRKRPLLLVGLLFVGVLAAGLVFLGLRFLGPFGRSGPGIFVDIERGTPSRVIARKLQQAGVVRSANIFWILHLLHPGTPLQAGEYQFALPGTPWAVFNKIRRGEIFYEQLTVPEGSNMFDIRQLLEPLHTAAANDFLQAAASPHLVADLDAQAPSLEGFLFPSTYRITHKTTGEQLCRLMVTQFRSEWQSLSNAHGKRADLHHVVVLASLVEKETGVKAERPVVAAVFTNRLQRNMPLQCDPTTVYAALMENRYRGVIHRSDLASTNPYNTYAHSGLPPGPISNPGVASLSAAMAPAKSDFLYFVARADGSGGHQFSSTLEAHERAVVAYRKEIKEAKEARP